MPYRQYQEIHQVNQRGEIAPRALFIHTRTGNRLRPSTISHLLCRLIDISQPGVVPRGHDVRKMATSLAWSRGLPVSEITDRAFWRSSNIFTRRYLKHLRTDPGQCVALGTASLSSFNVILLLCLTQYYLASPLFKPRFNQYTVRYLVMCLSC
jgi:hypothetical protein